MKKIYLSLFALALFNVSKAQTLTAVANEPVIGDIEATKGYDSVAVVPKATGAGQSWNFSAFTQNTTTPTSTFIVPAGAPSASVFTGATIAENTGAKHNYGKSVASPTAQFESLGTYDAGIIYSFTNSAVFYSWPLSLGSNNVDTYGGPISGSATGAISGTLTSTGSGTGTLTIPGGTTFTNVLQVKVINSANVVLTSPSSTTINVIETYYRYFSPGQKFPIIAVLYKSFNGAPNTRTITVNNAVIMGLNEKNFDATFQIFPNPAKDAFNVKLTNADNDNGVIEIFNVMGQLIKTVSLGNTSIIEQNVSLQDLSTGLYTVKTTLGNRVSSRKLIIE